MLGNLAIPAICGTVYGVTRDPRPAVPARPRADRGVLDQIPTVGAVIAGIIVGDVALSVGLEALIVRDLMAVYQQIENYVLQLMIIGRAAHVSGFTVLVSVLTFGALFGFIGAIIGVPIVAALQILIEELTAARRVDRGRGPG